MSTLPLNTGAGDATPLCIASNLASPVPSGAAAHRQSSVAIINTFARMAKQAIQSEPQFTYDATVWQRYDALAKEMVELFANGPLFSDGIDRFFCVSVVPTANLGSNTKSSIHLYGVTHAEP